MNIVKRALLVLSSALDGTPVLQLVTDAYSRLRAAVVDEELGFSASGPGLTVSCTTSTQLLPLETAPGSLVITNLDSSAAIYIGPTPVVSGTGIAIPAGQTFVFRCANPSLVYCIGSATVVAGVLR